MNWIRIKNHIEKRKKERKIKLKRKRNKLMTNFESFEKFQ